ncbi:MAG TPA: PqqD family protein [Solirubrobacteraceae bacterium]|nr:PqqD family protein [Solirubrobacteraceae bacterium]
MPNLMTVGSELPTTVSIPDSVLWQEVGDEIVLLDVEGGEYHGLNDVGSSIWRALEEHSDVSSAYEHLCGTYEVEPDVLRKDLDEFIKRLVGMGLLSVP